MSIIRPSLGQVFACISLLGAASFCYLLGAAVMFFQLPSSDYLRNAFIGAQAQRERGRGDGSPMLENPPQNQVTVDQPGKTSDGFTLYTTNCGAWASLIDMRGNIVHQWRMPFRQAWPHPTHVDPVPEQYWFGFHLFPNGDLLAVYQGKNDTPYGYGLVKLDKDSKLLWRYDGNVHHEVDVGDDGTIYAFSQKLAGKVPTGMDFVPWPYIADALVVLSPEGSVLDYIPILEAFRDSKYASTFELIMKTKVLVSQFDKKNPNFSLPSYVRSRGDYTHPNSVKVLRKAVASKFPLFKVGQVLLSLRNLDALAVVDIQKRSVVWSAQGCWSQQHSADFLENGHLLLYDNSGAILQTRVLEYDPVTQAIPWSYANENSKPFRAVLMGNTQRLPNGNTLIVHPDVCRIFEVTAAKEVVWESYCKKPGPVEADSFTTLGGGINTARRYPADYLVFLKGAAGVRP